MCVYTSNHLYMISEYNSCIHILNVVCDVRDLIDYII